MSKCPDARDCLRDLVVPAMEDVVDKVNFTLSFIGSNCLIASYSRIPSRDLVESCALEHGIPFDDLNGCISEEGKGLDLLEQSVERSQAAGVTKSCTVRVDDKMWCIRDGGEWKDCENGSDVRSLVKEVEKLYSG
ncbi:MAG: hypothetical protein LQ344_002448 [Seirophora lacunosa]|nr:MAG: hypothetical protein LQ344_002448 [Seirophora lacunosa]